MTIRKSPLVVCCASMRRSHHMPNRCSYHTPNHPQPLAPRLAAALAGVFLILSLAACAGDQSQNPVQEPIAQADPAPSQDTGADQTSGPAYTPPSTPSVYQYDQAQAVSQAGATIDVSRAQEGVVFATVISEPRCKFQVTSGDMSYNYDLPTDGTPLAVSLNMGSGPYTFRVMQNVGGTSYVEMMRLEHNVELTSEFAPYLAPSVFCNFDEKSACVAKAQEIAAGTANQAELLAAIYDWVITNITYDQAKAAELAQATGYVPDPDQTLAATSGICFDYASLSAAMLRSLGIPCQVVCGYVDPNDLYHAWNMVNIDGVWHSAHFSIEANTWARIDTTFGASGALETVGQGTGYRDRYIY